MLCRSLCSVTGIVWWEWPSACPEGGLTGAAFKAGGRPRAKDRAPSFLLKWGWRNIRQAAGVLCLRASVGVGALHDLPFCALVLWHQPSFLATPGLAANSGSTISSLSKGSKRFPSPRSPGPTRRGSQPWLSGDVQVMQQQSPQLIPVEPHLDVCSWFPS